MRVLIPNISIIATLIPFSAFAGEDKLVGRAEVNHRYGQERSITMTEFWVPFMQDDKSVLYGDLRMMGDDDDNREGNIGIGYREITEFKGFKGIIGVHAWVDRRITARNSTFNQATIGAEWLSDSVDILVNGYIPLSSSRVIDVPNSDPQGAALIGTGIVVDTDGKIIEEPQGGFDIELGYQLPFLKDYTDSFRIYGGGYYFNSDNAQSVSGWRARFTADINSDFQIGARFQSDDERGSQGFLEATIRFPFGQKKSYRDRGLYARLDDSPERDIDIVTGENVIDSGKRVAVINVETGAAQEVLHVDNSAGGGGNGSAENPFNTLAAAQSAASAQTIIYVNRGDGTTAGQNAGIALNQDGQQLIGSGADFIYDNGRFTTANGAPPTGTLIRAAGAAPVISNAAGDGINITADNITVAGITVDGASGDGIAITANGGAASAQNAVIDNVTAQNNRFGIYVYGANGGSVSAKIQNSVTASNAEHGIAIYDDTSGTFDADLGGGSMGSTGNNVLAGNTLEDLAVEMDGATLSAQNNWWGQASGADTDTPDIGIAPQIYYGAPINDGLLGNWTFDNEWTTNTTAYDRSGQGNDGTLQGGLSLADSVNGENRQGLNFDGTSDYVAIGASNLYIPSAGSQITILSMFSPASISSNTLDDRLVNIRRNAGSSTLIFAVGDDDNITYFNPSIGVEALNDNTISSGSFYGGALSYDGSNIIGYVNGIADSNVRAASLDAGNTSQAIIGSYTGASLYFNGIIDDTRIYNRALSAGEVAELYRMDTSSSVDTSNFLTSAP